MVKRRGGRGDERTREVSDDVGEAVAAKFSVDFALQRRAHRLFIINQCFSADGGMNEGISID